MNDQSFIDQLNARTPGFFKILGGQIAAINRGSHTCTIDFDVSTDLCHSVDVVQGGFVTAMLDAAMSHAVFATDPSITGVSSLEIKTSYLEPTRAGQIRAVGAIVKAGYKIVFLEGHLYNSEGLLTATTTSVAKLVREKNSSS